MPETKTKIPFTEEQAREYKRFQDNKAKMDILLAAGARVKGSRITLHFDSSGNINDTTFDNIHIRNCDLAEVPINIEENDKP